MPRYFVTFDMKREKASSGAAAGMPVAEVHPQRDVVKAGKMRYRILSRIGGKGVVPISCPACHRTVFCWMGVPW